MDAHAYRFLVDRMLGRLVAWLRIFGYDTKSALDLERRRTRTPGS